MGDADRQYWYNVSTKQVEEGHRSSWKDLMGPYATRAEAENALARAAARTEAWDREDERER
jgi:hypothetical protein